LRLLACFLFFDGENQIRARIARQNLLIVPFFGNYALLGGPGQLPEIILRRATGHQILEQEKSPQDSSIENRLCRNASSPWYFAGLISDVKPVSPSLDYLPAPLFVKNFQEFSMKQGVGGSQSGRVEGFFPEKWRIGACIGAGLGMVRIGKKGVPGGGSSDVFQR
jgi:hypothetical protein